MKTLLALVAVLTLALPAAAGPLGHDREQQQQSRIRDGVRDGELTQREARKLRTQQRRIDARQQRAACDGVVTRREARGIDRAQDHANRSIRREKHDRAAR